MPGKIHVPIAVNVQGMDKVTKAMGSLTRSVTTAVTAFTALAGTAAIKFGAEAIQGANDLERSLNGLETVFGSTTPQMVAFGQSATELGLSLSEAAKASTFIGSVIKQSGFEIQETADLTERLVTLGADLALTYGYDVQEALLGMTALFRGEYDPIEKFGVAMKQSEIDAEKLARGMGNLTGAAERFADQQIRVEFLFDRARDSMGQVERQAATLAVQQMKLNAAFSNTRDLAGQELIPVIAEFMGQLNDIVIRLTPKVIETFAAFREPMYQIGQILLPAIESALREFMNFMQDVAEIIKLATDPTSELGNALQDASNAITYLFEDFKRFGLEVPGFVEVVTGTIKFLAETVTNVSTAIQDVFWFIEAFVGALQRVDIGKLMFGNETEIRRFQGYISATLYAKNRMRDVALEQKNIEQDLAYQADVVRRIEANRLQQYMDFLNRRSLEAKEITRTIADTPDVEVGVKIDAKDPVADFFANLQNEIERQGARIKLQGLGLSKSLIEAIVGSGEDWKEIFEVIMRGGKDAAEALQEQFMKTKSGLDEYKQAVEDLYEELDKQKELELEIAEINAELARTIEEIKDRFEDFRREVSRFTESIDVLKTFEREIGRFEAQSARELEQIKSNLENAFDNEMIFKKAKDDLTAMAADEYRLLLGIQRDRDELFAQREAAADTIFSVARAVAESSDLLRILGDVEEKTSEIEITEVMEGIAKSADGLKDFKTTLTRTFLDTVTETVDKSRVLTDSFQSVIDRTRLFIDNLNTLKELGLDPFLFNQLVEAGAEAGGATAQALVEGGAATVNEVNKLQGQLNDMGVELGELTHEVMKDQGEMFVSGIIQGLDEQLGELELQAYTMAQAFADAFETAFNQAINAMELQQIQAAQAEAAQAIQDATNKLTPIIDEAAAAQLQTLIAGAQRYAENIGDLTKAAGAGTKATIYEGLLDDVLAGRAIDLSGVQSGMSSADLAQAALAARQPATVVNNNISVSADTPLAAYNAATATVDKLMTYQNSSGNFQVTLTGFGA
jgi:uncharacterized membrane-anchored protein YhcB (DUF1043 family)